nr:hypothetical protein [uncultured Trichococcus sp.]
MSKANYNDEKSVLPAFYREDFLVRVAMDVGCAGRPSFLSVNMNNWPLSIFFRAAHAAE